MRQRRRGVGLTSGRGRACSARRAGRAAGQLQEAAACAGWRSTTSRPGPCRWGRLGHSPALQEGDVGHGVLGRVVNKLGRHAAAKAGTATRGGIGPTAAAAQRRGCVAGRGGAHRLYPAQAARPVEHGRAAQAVGQGLQGARSRAAACDSAAAGQRWAASAARPAAQDPAKRCDASRGCAATLWHGRGAPASPCALRGAAPACGCPA